MTGKKKKMPNKFTYPIFEDRLYTIKIDGKTIEVLGKDIIKMVLDNTPES